MQVLAPLGGRPTPGEPFQHRDVRRNCGALDGAEIGALIPCWSASRVFADDAVTDFLGCGWPTVFGSRARFFTDGRADGTIREGHRPQKDLPVVPLARAG